MYIYLFIIQILQFQEPVQTNIESNSTLSIPSLDSEISQFPKRKKRGVGHLDKSSIISSDKRSKRTRNDKKYSK